MTDLTQLKYLKLSPDTIKDRARELAENHDRIPKVWDPNYVVTKERLDKTTEQIRTNCQNDFWFAIFEKNNLIGFYWLIEKSSTEGRALSLWVRPEMRGHGLGKKLKAFGHKVIIESKNYSIITTRVNLKNKAMIHLNNSLGFTSHPDGPWLEMQINLNSPTN